VVDGNNTAALCSFSSETVLENSSNSSISGWKNNTEHRTLKLNKKASHPHNKDKTVVPITKNDIHFTVFPNCRVTNL